MVRIQGEKIDQLVKSKIEVLNFSAPPDSSWNKNESWKIIRGKLRGSNKTLIVWGFSVAASISLLIAATINLDSHLFSEPIKPELSIESQFPIKETKKRQFNLKKELYKLDEITAIKLDNDFALPSYAKLIPAIDYVRQSVMLPEIKNYPKKDLLKPYFAIHTGNSGHYPTLGLNINLYSKLKNRIKKDVKLGVSSSFQIIETEQSKKILQFTYLNLAYSRTNEVNNRGWSTQVGYMINPDSNVYKTNTMKFSLNKRFTKHLKAGPEFIFTNNFKKVYPGVTIILS